MVEIESADEQGQTFTEINGLVHGKMVAQGVQNASERQVCFPVIGPIELRHQLL